MIAVEICWSFRGYGHDDAVAAASIASGGDWATSPSGIADPALQQAIVPLDTSSACVGGGVQPTTFVEGLVPQPATPTGRAAPLGI